MLFGSGNNTFRVGISFLDCFKNTITHPTGLEYGYCFGRVNTRPIGLEFCDR